MKLAAGALAGTLIAAPLLVASANYLNHADLGVQGGLVGSLNLQPHGLSMLLMPYVFGPIFEFSGPGGLVLGLWQGIGRYVSTSLLFFGVVGLLSPRRRGLKLILAAWLLLAIARVYDEPHLLGQVLGVVTRMSRVAFYR